MKFSTVLFSLITLTTAQNVRFLGKTTQSFADRLRDSASVQGSPNDAARYASARTGRSLARPWNVWEHVDGFTRELFSSPYLLDHYVGSVDTTNGLTNDVTIYGGFSCIDRGKATAEPIWFWAAPDLSPLIELKNETGGAEVGKSGEASTTDTLHQCWSGRKANPGLRTVEHSGFHRGEGALLVRRSHTGMKSMVGNNSAFQSLLDERKAQSEHNEVIYHSVFGIGLVLNLPFVTGFRMHVPTNHGETLGRDLRVPITPLLAMRRLFGIRLAEAHLAPSEPITSPLIIVTSLLSVVLTLMAALWIVVSFFSDDIIERSNELMRKGVDFAVHNTNPLRSSRFYSLVMHMFTAVVLLAPLILTILIGDADPRPVLEVTTGISITYGPQHDNFTQDPGNDFAGAPFHVSTYLTVREVHGSSYAAFFGTLAFVYFLLWIVFVLHSKRCSETIPTNNPRIYSWSFPRRAIGAFGLWWQHFSRPSSERVVFRVLVEFKDNLNWEVLMGALLLGAEGHRLNASLVHPESTDVVTARAEISHQLKEIGQGKSYQLYGRVTLDNSSRYEAMFFGTRLRNPLMRNVSRAVYNSWIHVMPRNWFRLTVCGGPEARHIEWYRTNGVFLHDRFLVAARLSLIPVLQDVRRIVLVEEESEVFGGVDDDGVRLGIIRNESPGSSPPEHDSSGSGGAVPAGAVQVIELLESDDRFPILREETFPWGGQLASERFQMLEGIRVATPDGRACIRHAVYNVA